MENVTETEPLDGIVGDGATLVFSRQVNHPVNFAR